MSKAELEANNISSEQGKEIFNFWDTCIFSDDGSGCNDTGKKSRCTKDLKKKLKKYKKRKNGSEDPEVLEVSLTLNESLTVTDYHNNNNEVIVDDFERPLNYLMKMVRQKSSQKNLKTLIDCKKSKEVENNVALQGKSPPEKHKNAFQLMMDSRNKSLGSNSPGKEKDEDDFESEVILHKKATKAKRNLLLQKMAESKGAHKNKEIEEVQEEIIKQKMQNRAERLKDMISKGSKSIKPKTKKKTKVKPTEIIETNNKKIQPLNKIIDFNVPVCPEPPVISPVRKNMTKEDQDFLNKLSPSLKKKENMLCYFKKIEKEEEAEIVLEDSYCDSEEVVSNNIIKVKLAVRNKKSTKKRKLSLKSPLVKKNDDNSKDCNENNFNSTNIDTNQILPKENEQDLSATRKRKRKTKLDENNPCVIPPSPIDSGEGRPRRNVKKPVKYSDEANLSSSDDELLVFTPKKKKHLDRDTVKIVSSRDKLLKGDQKAVKNKEKSQKARKSEPKGKLAPIFMPKPQIDPAAFEAKLKFLQSGVPEQLKKIAVQQTAQINNSISFHPVVHVLQAQEVPNIGKQLDFYKSCDDEDIDIAALVKKYDTDNFFKNMICLQEESQEVIKDLTPNPRDINVILESIKDSYPEFPVYRTYRTLKNKSMGDHTDLNFVEFDNSKEALDATVEIKNEDPNSLCWVEKYKATSTKQIIGNFDNIKELRKWLVSWTERQQCIKNSQGGNDSDSSDFYHSDTDSRDNAAITNNLLIVTGPTGSGKTSCIHAVAAELAIKVIEVNVGSRRTGKILLQDLQEATQSHKVNRGKGSSAENSQNSQNIFELSKQSKTTSKKKTKSNVEKSENLSQPIFSQEEGRTGMSLILIDDADIVFEQDDGFISGIAQLIQCSKRPVVLVTGSLTSQNVQRFLQCENVVKLRPLLPRMLGTWLDLVCLADTGTSWPGTGAKLLDHYRGDVRKATNYYNFIAHSQTQKQNDVEEEAIDDEQKNVDIDENSSMSWAKGDSEEIKCTEPLINSIGTPNCLIQLKDPSHLFDHWWIVHDIFGSRNKSAKDVKVLQDVTTVLDNLSFGDIMDRTKGNKSDICSSPWYNSEIDSVSERYSFESVNNFYDTCSEISVHLVESVLETNQSQNGDSMSFTLQRERDKKLARHTTVTESLVSGAVLDRRALALDYWPVFRAICRTEKVKTDNNSKRNNRFTHYLKTLKVPSKSEVLSKLGDSLQPTH